ncbi:DNA cytosine methyltransferase [Streptococcus gallolyticus]|uniref:DNA cytosine methyltransferase n=1 Tax=Streptococcus gallolyticus TaxID=315405 RepID=UPI002283B8A5|nr:DNA cytosine methyltransferase [Streptococcus gallolyticus]MCY7187341.1 DNA cytosine methyltransferase [Streptococcus gallolyticus subsp. gallolyticus]
MPYAIDLFCGAGGCSKGLIQSGFHILFSSDISEMVEKTYVNRHEQLGLIQGKNTWFERRDIRELTGSDIKNISLN